MDAANASRTMVWTERREHLDILSGMLEGRVDHLIVLKGGMGRRDLKGIESRLREIPETESRVILATGSFLGEGFDDSRLDTLFLAMPISWKGKYRRDVRLPVPFGTNPYLQVDLCSEAEKKVVFIENKAEIAKPAEFRRARRQDVLLQAGGYKPAFSDRENWTEATRTNSRWVAEEQTCEKYSKMV